MGVDPQERQAWMPPRLGGERRDGGAMIAAKHREESCRWNLGQAIGDRRPTRLDVRAGIEVAQVIDTKSSQQPAVFGHGRYGRGEAAHALRRQGSSLSVNRRAVVRNARDDRVGRLERTPPQAAPWPQSVEVHRFRISCTFSGTFKMSRAPISNQMKKIEKITG